MKSEKNRATGRLVLGAYLILIGGLIFASNLGWDVPRGVWNYWPFLLIAGGGLKMLLGDREALSEGFWLLLAGLYCWVSVWNLWGLSWGTAWPIFVVAGGLSMILEPWFGTGKRCLGGKRDAESKEADHVG